MTAISRPILSLALAASVVITSLPGAYAQSKEQFERAPLNPAFEQHQAKRTLRSLTPDGHALGYRPGPIEVTLPRKNLRSTHAALPSTYDLRTLGRVTPVRDQGSCGACWTFATLGPVESSLLPEETWDFSENNLRNNHGFDWSACDGGNVSISTANLARWTGPVLEADDPYRDKVDRKRTGLPVQKHIQDVLYLPERQNPLDNAAIKESIMKYGGLYMGFAYDDRYFANQTHAYYYPGTKDSNHAVTLIGWDDDYDKNNFANKPKGNGAFLAKNSWGTKWGDDGFFYISYYDRTMQEFTAFPKPESADTTSHIYQYDELGWTESLGTSAGSDTAWFANLFTPGANEQLKAISFYTTGHDAQYEVKVYTDVNPIKGPLSGQLAGKTSGKEDYMGYHTVQLKEPIQLAAGSSFAVVVKMTVPESAYPIALESPIKAFSSKARADALQSFVSSNGSNWTDLTTIPSFSNSNVTIKAFTVDAAKELSKLEIRDEQDKKKLSTITLDAGGATRVILARATYTDKSSANVSGSVKLKSNSNKKAVAVSVKGDVITLAPKAAGTAKLRFMYENKTVTLTVKVK
ncbi:MAG: lectin like domain-containing protein [Clostridia bacterium]